MNLHTQVINEINRVLFSEGIDRADLAARMGIASERLDAMLDDIEAWDVVTLAGVATALDVRVSLNLRPAAIHVTVMMSPMDISTLCVIA